MLRSWMDCLVTQSGLLVAQMPVQKRPLPVQGMLDEWLQRYRHLAHLVTAQRTQRQPHRDHFSSEGETDEE